MFRIYLKGVLYAVLEILHFTNKGMLLKEYIRHILSKE